MSTDYFKKECVRAANLIKRYKNQIYNCFCQAETRIVSREFSSGGDMLHRGFYCPSMVLDVIAGNAKRGKLIFPSRHRQTPTYTYGFDQEDRLVTVSKGNEREIVWYEGMIETSIVFREAYPENSICYLSECAYENNRIVSYAIFIYDPLEQVIAHMTRETYSYEVDHVLVELVQFSNIKPWILQRDKFVFSLKNRRLTDYYLETKTGYTICHPICNERIIPPLTNDGPYKRYHADQQ